MEKAVANSIHGGRFLIGSHQEAFIPSPLDKQNKKDCRAYSNSL